MNTTAQIYRAEILRAVLGPRASELKVDNPARLAQIAEHLVHCEQAQAALRAKGYGCAGMTFLEVAHEVPVNALGRIKGWFAPKASAAPYPELGEVHDIWSAR
jgi:hypothetical protein